MVFKVVFFVG